jgi:hypothetical protein
VYIASPNGQYYCEHLISKVSDAVWKYIIRGKEEDAQASQNYSWGIKLSHRWLFSRKMKQNWISTRYFADAEVGLILRTSDICKDWILRKTFWDLELLPFPASAARSPYVSFSCGNIHLCNILKPCHVSICLIFSSYLMSYIWSISATWHKYGTTNPAHLCFDL